MLFMKRQYLRNEKGSIIIGGHIQALGIVRILGERGIPVVVVDNTYQCVARASKYCKGFFKVRDELLFEFLNNEIFRRKYEGWTIFPTNDMHVRLLSMNRQSLERSYLISTDKWEVVKTFYNKKETYRLAQKLGIPLARTYYPKDRSSLEAIDILFPCIIKPAVMYDFYKKSGKKVLICKDFNDMLRKYDEALNIIPADEIIIQEIIQGSGWNQYSACFLFLEGKTYVSLTACRLRQHPPDFGNATTYAETVEMPDLKNIGEKLLGSVKYNGICEIEFKRDDRDNEFKLLEVNPRTWKWHSIANKTGTPFIPLFFDYLAGRTINPVEGFKHAAFCHYLTDIPIRLKLLLKGADNWKQLSSPLENATWSARDPLPWIFEKILIFNFLIRR